MNALTFEGFEPSNTTPVPDVLFDVLLPYLNEAQLKVMLYIIRRTLGFKKTSDAISLNQFRRGITTKEGKKLDDGCGLKNFTTISKALKELEQMNCIESDKRETDEGNNLTTVYRIRFRGTTQNVVGTTDSVVGVLRKTHDRTTPSGGRVLRKTYPQETVLQDTVKQETEESNSESSEKHTFVSSDTARTDSLSHLLESWKQGDEQEQQENLRILQEAGIVPFETPQGDDHAAVPASGHSHRVDDAAACGNDTSHTAVDSGQVAPPENRPVLETRQEIDKGEHHGHCVPAVPAANPATPSERHVSRSDSEHSRDITYPDNGFPVVRAVGIGTPGQETGRDTAQVAKKGHTDEYRSDRLHVRSLPSNNNRHHTFQPMGDTRVTPERLANTSTPMPAQSLSLPQAEQAAWRLSGSDLNKKNRAIGLEEPNRGNPVEASQEVLHQAALGTPQIGPNALSNTSSPTKQTTRTRKPAQPKPETPKGPPVEPPADIAWGTRKCLMWFDFWRGGILIGKWKLMQASTCAKGLAEQFDEQTVIQAHTDMEADPYYIDKGGCDVCDVANNIHKYLKRRQSKQQPAIQPALKVVKRYSSYDDPNFRSDQDFYPVEGGSYATASR